MRFREPAICIRTTDYSETSQVVHFLTRAQGVARLLAKGTKRPKSSSGGMIDLLSEGDLVYSSSGRDTLGTLIEFAESVSQGPLRTNTARLNSALYLIELAGELLAEGDPHPEVFDLLHNALARLRQSDSPVPAVVAYFQWRLLELVGLLGQLEACVSCGRAIAPGPKDAPDTYFSSRQGGLLCDLCHVKVDEKVLVPQTALVGLAVLKAVSTGQRPPLPPHEAAAVNRLLAYHISQQTGKRLRMARHVIG